MDINIEFPQVTNRESFSQRLTLNDDETGDPIDLTPYTNMACEVRRMSQSRIGDLGYSSTYDYGSYGQSPLITLGLGSGITIVDVGVLQLDIAASQMRSLEPGYYSIALVIADGATTDPNTHAAQIFVGGLPVLWGGVS